MKTTTILTSIIAITFAIPSFATTVQNGANCDSGVLETTSGSAELNATWSANTIHLDFDPQNGGSHISGTCTYDGGITLPTQPQRTGYNFVKWQVKAPPAQCDLSGLDTSIGGIVGGGKDSDYCQYYKEGTEDISENCSDTWFSDLNVGEWKTEFSYGLIKGISFCSAKSGNNHNWQWGGNSADWSATYDELTSAGTGKYCWCSVTNYTPNGGETCPAVSRWVFNYDIGSAPSCASYCAIRCGYRAQAREALRVGLFGQN